MGLDITAYRRLRPVPDAPRDADGFPVNYDEHWLPGTGMKWSEMHWPGRGSGVDPDTVYAFEEAFSFRAGSYGSYGQWRDDLARMVGYLNAEDAWDHPDPNKPFIELINFADNEGVIGPIVSGKLAGDFNRHNPPEHYDDWWHEKWDHWKKAFNMAADNGAVEFH